MKVSRRRFLKLGAMAGAGLALPLGTLSIPLPRLGAAASVRGPSVEPFQVPLPIPPVLEPVRTGTDTDYYEMSKSTEYPQRGRATFRYPAATLVFVSELIRLWVLP